MPIKVPDDLPAKTTLALEAVPLIGTHEALVQDIRPLKIAILNLMPDKIKTETQLARLLGQSPLQIELTLIKVESHQSKNTSREHLLNFYQNWEAVSNQFFDGFIITGSPVEKIPFTQVDYWQELTEIFDWSLRNVNKVFTICWGAQAALYHFYGIDKYLLPQKRFGIYPHDLLLKNHYLVRGINDSFPIPVSRHTEIRQNDLNYIPHLENLIASKTAGACLISDPQKQYLYMFNHLEYDSYTLKEEYERDLKKDANTALPVNYFIDDNSSSLPVNIWRSGAHLLFRNWIDDIYRTTPFILSDMKPRQ